MQEPTLKNLHGTCERSLANRCTKRYYFNGEFKYRKEYALFDEPLDDLDGLSLSFSLSLSRSFTDSVWPSSFLVSEPGMGIVERMLDF